MSTSNAALPYQVSWTVWLEVWQQYRSQKVISWCRRQATMLVTMLVSLELSILLPLRHPAFWYSVIAVFRRPHNPQGLQICIICWLNILLMLGWLATHCNVLHDHIAGIANGVVVQHHIGNLPLLCLILTLDSVIAHIRYTRYNVDACLHCLLCCQPPILQVWSM